MPAGRIGMMRVAFRAIVLNEDHLAIRRTAFRGEGIDPRYDRIRVVTRCLRGKGPKLHIDNNQGVRHENNPDCDAVAPAWAIYGGT